MRIHLLVLLMSTLSSACLPATNLKKTELDKEIPPRSYHKKLKSPSHERLDLHIATEIRSQDQYGNLRLQIRFVSPQQQASRKEIKEAIAYKLAIYQKKYAIIWAEIISNQNPPQLLAKIDWFNPNLPQHQRYSIAKSEELFRGLLIEYHQKYK
jgi:hypothetical protein